MIELYKKRGETPLAALDRLRIERPELAQETLSYAGRLDPMAEGILPVLVGREENIRRQEFLHRDKEYEAHFLIGCATDTNDVLGVIQKINFIHIDESKIKKVCEELIQITKQTYPWYSSKPVDGVSLFEHARKGNFDITRPTKDVKIYSVSHISVYEESLKKLIEQNSKDVKSVVGDFRQEEIVRGWENLKCHPELVSGSFSKDYEIPHQVRDDNTPKPAQLVSCTLHVSSGTYIRALCEHLEQELGVPVLLQKLVRTRVF